MPLHKLSGQTQPIHGNPSDGQRERQADRDKQTQRQTHKLRVSRNLLHRENKMGKAYAGNSYYNHSKS